MEENTEGTDGDAALSSDPRGLKHVRVETSGVAAGGRPSCAFLRFPFACQDLRDLRGVRACVRAGRQRACGANRFLRGRKLLRLLRLLRPTETDGSQKRVENDFWGLIEILHSHFLPHSEAAQAHPFRRGLEEP